MEPITREEVFMKAAANGEVTPEPITRTELFLKKIADNVKGGGVTSWNDLTDKPFGEETVGGDTLTWDGNTEGRANAAGMFFKVSDAMPSESDFANGYIVCSGGEIIEVNEETFGDECYLTTPGILMGMGVVVAYEDGSEYNGMVFPKAGTYLGWHEDVGEVSYLTIPGYTGFTTTVVKPLDEKYLPTLTSPSGKKFKLSVSDDGTLIATEVN
jgi:hypothetical protein